MLALLQVIVLVAGVGASAIGWACERRHALAVDALPQAIHSDGQDRFYLAYRGQVLRVDHRVDGVYRFDRHIGNQWLRDMRTAVNREGVVGVVLHLRARRCNHGCSARLVGLTCEKPGLCRVVRTVGLRAGRGVTNRLRGEIGLNPAGELGFGLDQTVCSRSKKRSRCSSTTTWYCPGGRCNRPRVLDLADANREVPPLARPECAGANIRLRTGAFVGARGRVEVPGPAMYHKTCLIDRAGRPHIIFHDPSEKGIRHAWLPNTGAKVENELVDGPESGIYNAAAALPDGRLAIFAYTYRNAFNKGVTAVLLDRAGKEVDRYMVARARDENPGWGLRAAASPGGRILLAYHADARDKRPVVTVYDSTAQMKRYALPEPNGWERDYQNYFFLAGAGGFYPLWFFRSATPDDKDGVPQNKIYKPRYDVESTLVNSFKFEGRYESLNLALTYMRGFINDAIEDAAGEVASTAFDKLMGSIGWDRLIFYHDLRLGAAYSRIRGRYRDANGFDADQVFDSDYTRFTATLLNAYRIRYGLFYQTYDFYIPVYVYRAAAGSTSYRFADSFGSGVRFHDVGVTIGYSRLDYAAKYENQVFDWFVDVDAGIGVSVGKLADARQVAGEQVGSAVSFMLPFNVELGLLAYKRFYALHGFGGYARVAYKLEGNYTGSVGKPDDRDSDKADDADVTARFNRFELRHGPYLDVGLVF